MKNLQNKPESSVFAKDEMSLVSVDPMWTAEELLQRSGVFFLKDVVRVLDCDPLKVKKNAKELRRLTRCPWSEMGIKKIWNHWVVRMSVFAPYYRRNLVSKVDRIDSNWDGNRLLKQKGLFLLSEVSKLIPFTTHQLRYQAKKNPRAREEIGIWKDPDLHAFVVDMERFAPWIRNIWGGNCIT